MAFYFIDTSYEKAHAAWLKEQDTAARAAAKGDGGYYPEAIKEKLRPLELVGSNNIPLADGAVFYTPDVSQIKGTIPSEIVRGQIVTMINGKPEVKWF